MVRKITEHKILNPLIIGAFEYKLEILKEQVKPDLEEMQFVLKNQMELDLEEIEFVMHLIHHRSLLKILMRAIM